MYHIVECKLKIIMFKMDIYTNFLVMITELLRYAASKITRQSLKVIEQLQHAYVAISTDVQTGRP